jgi:hypothetical protein
MVDPKGTIGLDLDNHASEDPGSPIITGILLPGSIRSYPVKVATLQDDWLSAVITPKRAAIGSHGCQGTNGRLAMTCCSLDNLIGIGPMHFQLFNLL